MEEVDLEVINEIIQLEISNYIKEHRDMDKKELVKNIEKIMDKKEELMNCDKEEYKKILKRNKRENECG